MASLNFDDGQKRYEVNNSGVYFTFNPTDPNMAGRFFDFYNNLEANLKALSERVSRECQAWVDAEDSEEKDKAVELLDQAERELDREVKEKLQEVFGYSNDFDAIFAGASILAPTKNDGTTVLVGFLEAAARIILDETKAIKKAQTEKINKAIKKTKTRRNKG